MRIRSDPHYTLVEGAFTMAGAAQLRLGQAAPQKARARLWPPDRYPQVMFCPPRFYKAKAYGLSDGYPVRLGSGHVSPTQVDIQLAGILEAGPK